MTLHFGRVGNSADGPVQAGGDNFRSLDEQIKGSPEIRLRGWVIAGILLVWPLCIASSSVMGARFGPRAARVKGPRFVSRCRVMGSPSQPDPPRRRSPRAFRRMSCFPVLNLPARICPFWSSLSPNPTADPPSPRQERYVCFSAPRICKVRPPEGSVYLNCGDVFPREIYVHDRDSFCNRAPGGRVASH
jgi:hypothetical protein